MRQHGRSIHIIQRTFDSCSLKRIAAVLPLSQICGRLAQLVRAPARHAGGHWFESSIAHHLPFRAFRRLLVSEFFELFDVALP